MKVYAIIKKWANEGTYEDAYGGCLYLGVYATLYDSKVIIQLDIEGDTVENNSVITKYDEHFFEKPLKKFRRINESIVKEFDVVYEVSCTLIPVDNPDPMFIEDETYIIYEEEL